MKEVSEKGRQALTAKEERAVHGSCDLEHFHSCVKKQNNHTTTCPTLTFEPEGSCSRKIVGVIHIALSFAIR